MDQELKQRLIGAAVITALAAIFVPMLFDDPVDESGQIVNELVLPDAPVKAFDETASQLPADTVENRGEYELADKVEDFETVEEMPTEDDDFKSEPWIEEPVDDVGFEPEPFVEEPIYEAEYESETIVKERDIKPKPSVKEPAAKPEKPSKAPEIRADVVGWYIQLGSFSQKDNAFSLHDKLRAKGFPASVDEINTGSGKAYRLIVGPELDKTKAQAMQAKLESLINTKSLLIAAGQAGTTKMSMPVAKTQPPSAVRPAAKAETAASTPVESDLVRWYIQLGSFSKQENAYSLRDKLRSQGFPVIIDEVNTTNGKTYRLRAGPELDKKRAEAMQAKLEQQNHLNSLLVSE